MEEKITAAKNHKVLLNNRKTGSFTGILDVLSFDISEILLETELGMLHIKGKDLHVNRLNLEKGEVDLEGLITSMEYSEVAKQGQKGESFFGKLFR
jgi:sporulation protein YabP